MGLTCYELSSVASHLAHLHTSFDVIKLIFFPTSVYNFSRDRRASGPICHCTWL